MSSEQMTYVWQNGFYVTLGVGIVCFLMAVIFFIVSIGDGEDNKLAARISLLLLFGVPVAAVIWPVAVAGLVLVLVWALVYGAIKGF